MMPPLFRDKWLQWEKEEADAKAAEIRDKEREREAMLSSLVQARAVK
jgi:hypothetical protein